MEQEITLVLGTDRATIECHPVADGTAAVCSARAPNKDSPNEDGAAVIPCGPARGVLAVADGMGGQSAGEVAARLVLTELADAVRDAAAADGLLRAGILNGIERANVAIKDLGVGAATTLAAVEVEDGRIRPYHVGDSMVLVVGQKGKVKLQTVSHSPVGYAVESGLLSETDALHHEDRHLVSNAVGSGEMRIEVGPTLQLRPRDTVVLASDGLFDNLHTNEIIEHVRKGPLRKATHSLVAVCNERMRRPREGVPSKPDDLTCILFRLNAARSAVNVMRDSSGTRKGSTPGPGPSE